MERRIRMQVTLSVIDMQLMITIASTVNWQPHGHGMCTGVQLHSRISINTLKNSTQVKTHNGFQRTKSNAPLSLQIYGTGKSSLGWTAHTSAAWQCVQYHQSSFIGTKSAIPALDTT